MSTAYGFEPVFRTTKCTAQPRRALYLVILMPESLTLTPIVTCTAGAVVALADGSSAIAATEPTTNKMDNRVLIDEPRVDRNRAGGLCGSRTSNGGRCRRGTPLHPAARHYLTVRYPVIPSST